MIDIDKPESMYELTKDQGTESEGCSSNAFLMTAGRRAIQNATVPTTNPYHSK